MTARSVLVIEDHQLPRAAAVAALEGYDVTEAATVGSRTAPHAERGAFRLMELAIYSAALTDAQWAQVVAHARAAHGVR